MRRSADRDDPGYAAFRRELDLGTNLRILLNGEEQKFVFAADEEEGFILRGIPDSEGRLQINRETDNVMTERVEGKVQIIVEPAGA